MGLGQLEPYLMSKNVFNVQGTGAILQHYDSGFADSQQYGSLAFFSNNEWNGVSVTYNVSKSSVTVQSEYIPSPPPDEHPVYSGGRIKSLGAEWLAKRVIPHEVRACDTCDDSLLTISL